MATFSYVLYPGDGTTTNFSFPFPYLDPAHIQVKVDGVQVAFTFLNTNTIKLATPAPSGKVVEIKRVTVQSNAPVDFTDGSVLREIDLDKLVLFATYAAQEAIDTQLRTVYQKANGDYTAGGFRLADVADPVNPTDAVNKQYFENVYTPQLDAKVAAATQKASDSYTNAFNAAGSASSAATAATNAAGSASTAAVLAALAQDWANKTDGTVNGSEYSAKYYAQQAASSAAVATQNKPSPQFLTGDGTTRNFTLSISYPAERLEVRVNGVMQEPTYSYTVNNTTLQFTEAPSNGARIFVRYI